MKKVSLLLSMLLAQLSFAQTQVYTFESVPPNAASTGSALTVSSDHRKQGANALKWSASNGDIFTLSSLGVSAAQTYQYGASSCQLWFYSPSASNDELTLEFLDRGGVVKRTGRLLLNYKGWRDYHRSYRYDYDNGNELPGFALDKIRITFRHVDGLVPAIVYMDNFEVYGDTQMRIPGPHMKLDFAHFKSGGGLSYNDPLRDFLSTPDLAVSPSTSTEQSEATEIAKQYPNSNKNPRATPAPLANNLTAARSYVDNLAITRNADGSINGRPHADMLDFAYPGQVSTILVMTKLSNYAGYLACSYLNDNTRTADRNRLLLFVEYLIDQGFAEGGRQAMQTNDYSVQRSFCNGFLQGMSLYPAGLKADVIKLLKWVYDYNTIYFTDPLPDISTDYIHIKLLVVFELIGLEPDPNTKVRDMKSASRLLSLYPRITTGDKDGVKADGCIFHHNALHPSYHSAYGTYSSLVNSMKGTSFRLTQTGYNNIAKAYMTDFTFSLQRTIQTSGSTGLFPNTLCGRDPFRYPFPISRISFKNLVQVGGDIAGRSADPKLAAVYNYFFPNGPDYFTDIAPANMDRFWQFNYGQIGIQRRRKWLVAMRGFTNKMWGTEIYPFENRYGRYQSYGTLEVCYQNSAALDSLYSCGYNAKKGNGWDWNIVPGCTSVILPYTSLQPNAPRADEYQEKTFVGALSLGKNGIFAMDFDDSPDKHAAPPNLKFQKSVFSFDSVFVCLGSGINAASSGNKVVTGLFQSIHNWAGATNSAWPAIYVNNATPVSGAYNSTVSTESSSTWLINGQSTGYYIPVGGGNVNISRGSQTTPWQSDTDGSKTATANYSKAYIDHDVNPSDAKYQFVMIPNMTTSGNIDPSKMRGIATSIEEGKVYTILSHTKLLHAVRSEPDSLIAYASFGANETIGFGNVGSISGNALLGVKKWNDTLRITANNPDMNAISTADGGWIPSNSSLAIKLNGGWHLQDNPSGAAVSVSSDCSFVTINYTLEGAGVPQTIKFLALKVRTLNQGNITGIAPDGVAITNSVDTDKSTPGFITYTYWKNRDCTEAVPEPGRVTEGGYYYIKGTDANNCSAVAKVHVTLVPRQTITFATIPDKTYGEADFSPGATTNGTSPVTYTSGNPEVATIVNGKIHITGVGTSIITASAIADAQYVAATDVSRTLTVLKAPQTISLNIPSLMVGGDTYTAAPVGGASGNPVLLTAANNKVSVSGFTITPLNAGKAQISATQQGNSNYLDASTSVEFCVNPEKPVITKQSDNLLSSNKPLGNQWYQANVPLTGAVSQTLTVNRSGQYTVTTTIDGCISSHSEVCTIGDVSKPWQTITFAAIPDKTYGEADFSPGATTNSTSAVTYVSSNPAVATIVNGMIHITGVGTSTITASAVADAQYDAAADVPQTLTVLKAPQTISLNIPSLTVGGNPYTAAPVGGASGNPVLLTAANNKVSVSGFTITPLNAGKAQISATQPGNSNYLDASVSVEFCVNPGKSVITRQAYNLLSSSEPLGNQWYKDDVLLAGSASQTLTISISGNYTVTTTIDGCTSAHSEVYTTGDISKPRQTITFATIPDKTYGEADFLPGATTNSTSAVTYVSSNSAVATIMNGMIHITGAGISTITASATEDAQYDAATDVPQTLTVLKAPQTISLNIPSLTVGGDPYTAAPTVGASGNPVLLTTTTNKVSVSGFTITPLNAGKAQISATQPGDSNYFEASTSVDFCVNPKKPVITKQAYNLLSSSEPLGNQWYEDDVLLAGAVSQTLTTSRTGNYTVTTTIDGCVSLRSDPLIYTGDISKSRGVLSAYPNPAGSELNVVLGDFDINSEVSITIYDLPGQSCYNKISMGSKIITVSTAALSAGAYIILVTQGDKRSSKLFVKN